MVARPEISRNDWEAAERGAAGKEMPQKPSSSFPRYFPAPEDGDFYSGSTLEDSYTSCVDGSVVDVGNRHSYYAFEDADVLFVFQPPRRRHRRRRARVQRRRPHARNCPKTKRQGAVKWGFRGTILEGGAFRVSTQKDGY